MKVLSAFLEREAGHVAAALVLIFVGYLLWLAKMPKAEDVLPFALGILARSMVGPGKDAGHD